MTQFVEKPSHRDLQRTALYCVFGRDGQPHASRTVVCCCLVCQKAVVGKPSKEFGKSLGSSVCLCRKQLLYHMRELVNGREVPSRSSLLAQSDTRGLLDALEFIACWDLCHQLGISSPVGGTADCLLGLTRSCFLKGKPSGETVMDMFTRSLQCCRCLSFVTMEVLRRGCNSFRKGPEISLSGAEQRGEVEGQVESLQEADTKIDELAASGQLDPALLLTMAKAYSAAKDTDVTREEVKDIMAHLYFKVSIKFFMARVYFRFSMFFMDFWGISPLSSMFATAALRSLCMSFQTIVYVLPNPSSASPIT